MAKDEDDDEARKMFTMTIDRFDDDNDNGHNVDDDSDDTSALMKAVQMMLFCTQ